MFWVGFVLMIDILGFMGWVASGQIPIDNFHIGIITKSIISLII